MKRHREVRGLGKKKQLFPALVRRAGAPGQYLPAESRLNAIAVPMTSCMSEPTMASSMVSQRRVRGT